MKFKMAFKKVLLVAIMATTMFTMVACGDTPSEGAPPQGNNEPPVSNDVVEPEQNNQEVIAEDGTHTGTVNTIDEKGQIKVELTIVASQPEDFKVIEQDGIEIDEATIESFKNHLVNNTPIEEVTGDKEEIELLMQASIAALNQSL